MSTTCFLAAAALAATRATPVATLTLAIAAWVTANLLIHQVDWPVWGAAALNAAALGLALAALRLWARPERGRPAAGSICHCPRFWSGC